ncbi:hypothetical protein PsorP6_009455 [Peronosclerospora sorghi]|uniref:Uncharacterized protein n=1 Tax=Peronosclerospora sorghi TaxID=230839 RepID=A0ACC0VZG4_9STRA|nr:hypothetical protein PsorP6_009455 [Peronosclerospora sorghi]
MLVPSLPPPRLRRIFTRRCMTVPNALKLAGQSVHSAADSYLSRRQTIRTEQEMEILGKRLARGRERGDILFLRGDLGTGKTCVARGFVREFTQRNDLIVTSPTYLLVNSYDDAADVSLVYHVDLYRLDAVTEQDMAALGLAEAFERGITLVEWPERLDQASVPSERLDVWLSYDDDDAQVRHVELEPIGERWKKFADASLC